MKKVYFLILLFLIAATSIAQAQARFDRVDTITVKDISNNLLNPWAGGINYPLISEIDLNGDGIHDMFVFDVHNNRVLPYLNDGSAGISAWHYAPEFVSRFPPINKWAMLYDYNCDGKKDLFTLSTSPPSGITVYRNDYTSGGGLQWTLVSSFLMERFATITTNIFASGVSIPTFVDIDSDGDMDIMGYNSVPDGRIVFHRNVSMDQFGHCDSLKFEYATGCWGNFALRIGSTNSVSCFHCPCREASPTFIRQYEDPIPYDPAEAARRDDTISSVFALDLDGDGDKELLIGDISAETTLMIHNGGTPTVAEMDTQDIEYPITDVSALFQGFHFHSYLDIDNDSKKDLLVMANEFENRRGIWWYKNSGTNASPVFSKQTEGFLQSEMIDVGENATPVLFDYNADGLLDLIIGGSVYQSAGGGNKNSLFIYKNTGTLQVPKFELVSDDLAGIASLGYSSPLFPAFGDLDGDGDSDLLLGLEDGTMQYFNNSAGAGNPVSLQLALPNFMGIDVGNSASPQLFDLNKDGKLDVIAGEKNGFVNYFENSGSASSAFFPSVPTNDTLGCIVRQQPSSTDGFTVPFLYDSLGKSRLLVSNLSGNIFQYTNISSNIAGCFTLADSVFDFAESFRIKANLAVSGGDLNGDGLVDIVVGLASGGVHVFMQRDPFLSVNNPDKKQLGFDCYPNPASEKVRIVLHDFNPGEFVEISLTDYLGKQVYSQKSNTADVDLNLKGIANGVYFVIVKSGQQSVAKKIIVNQNLD